MFIAVSKNLMKKIGIVEAVIVSEVLNREHYEGEWVCLTVNDLEEQIGINKYAQRKAINMLRWFGVVETKLDGIPAKRYIRIIRDGLTEVNEG